MRFGFWIMNHQPTDHVIEYGQHAEATGWDSLWYADHFMPNEENVDQPVYEAWSVLAALAVSVPRVRLGPMVAGNTYRNPALTAKIAATIDHLSGGRLVLGIGAGWQENEHAAYGFDFGTLRSRMDRFDESVEIISSLLGNHRTNFAGEHYTMTEAPLDPKPVQTPIPLLIGGGGRRRTLRTTARWANEWNFWGTPESIEELCGVLDGHCEAIGRDPAEISRSACSLVFISDDPAKLDRLRSADTGRATMVGTPDEISEVVEQYRQIGVDELIIPDVSLGSTGDKKHAMDLLINEVAPNFR